MCVDSASGRKFDRMTSRLIFSIFPIDFLFCSYALEFNRSILIAALISVRILEKNKNKLVS